MPVETLQTEVFTEIYNKYYSRIYKYILFRVGDHFLTEDLVSEVFEKVFLKYHTFTAEKGRFDAWLFTIANNTVINYFKKNKHKLQTANLEKIEGKFRLEDLIIEQELKEFLLQAIMCLKERERNIIALKFGACLTNREIAQLLDLSESNVGTILYRSLKHLKDILKEKLAFTS